jgi:hypothetical protein
MSEISAAEKALLLDAAKRLAARGYAELSYLQDIPHIEERKAADGALLTIRAEARDGGDGDFKLIVPIELWRGKDVHWIHLFVDRDEEVRVDEELCTNPPK